MRHSVFSNAAFLFLLAGMSLFGAEPVLRPGDRVVFIGDSITGQGGSPAGGWVALIGKALKEHDAASHQTLVALGGSGQSVSSWGNVEKKSRTAPVVLDVKSYDLQTELGRPADVVVIMLGMNDVLSPSLKDEPAGYQKWIGSYRSLISAIRERTTPRIMALGTPTPCTEDPESPKNRVMDKMVDELRKLAAEEKCLLLPTRETAWEVLQKGRRLRPDFHITSDQVHPSGPGHAAIAAGMLRGLGEDAAANIILGGAASGLHAPKGAHALSYEVSLMPQEASGADLRFRIRAFHSGDKVELELPEGWKLEETKTEAGESMFVVNAVPDRLVNRIVLRGGGESSEMKIPAAWLVGTGNIGWQGWKAGVFEIEAGRLPVDDTIRTGQGLAKSMAKMELKPGVPLVWNRFVGGVNYGGSGAPGALDFAGITYFTGGEVGYGLRWIQSDRERPVIVKISKMGFAGSPHLETWLNGQTIYAGDPGKVRDQNFPTTLKQGWNLLSFKSNFQQWQWQFAIDLEPVEGDSLDALRFSVVPR